MTDLEAIEERVRACENPRCCWGRVYVPDDSAGFDGYWRPCNMPGCPWAEELKR